LRKRGNGEKKRKNVGRGGGDVHVLRGLEHGQTRQTKPKRDVRDEAPCVNTERGGTSRTHFGRVQIEEPNGVNITQ